MIKRGSFLEAIAVFIGTVIGAGILGIPFALYKAGFLTGLISIVLIGVAVLVMNLFLSEIILKTKGNHQLTGYAEKYLGKTGKKLMAFAMIFGIYGALIAYIIGEGKAFAAIFNGSPFLYSIIFFLVFSLLLFLGLDIIKHSEFLLVTILLLVAIAIIILSFGDINISNLNIFNPYLILAPYGVILFALLGTAAIPEMKEILIKKSNLKKAVIIGSISIAVIYILFTLVVIGVCGNKISEIATICLGDLINPKMIVFGNLFAIFSMTTSFLALSLALQEMYNYDYGLTKIRSWLLTIIPPILVFILGIQSFIKTIAITGAVTGSLIGILISLMYRKFKKNKISKFSSLMTYIIIIMFVLGFIFTIKGI